MAIRTTGFRIHCDDEAAALADRGSPFTPCEPSHADGKPLRSCLKAPGGAAVPPRTLTMSPQIEVIDFESQLISTLPLAEGVAEVAGSLFATLPRSPSPAASGDLFSDIHLSYETAVALSDSEIIEKLSNKDFIERIRPLLARFSIELPEEDVISQDTISHLRAFYPLLSALRALDEKISACERSEPSVQEESFKELLRYISIRSAKRRPPQPGIPASAPPKIASHNPLFTAPEILDRYVVPRIMTLHDALFSERESPYLKTLIEFYELSSEDAIETLPRVILLGDVLTRIIPITYMSEAMGFVRTHPAEGIHAHVLGRYQGVVKTFMTTEDSAKLIEKGFLLIQRAVFAGSIRSNPELSASFEREFHHIRSDTTILNPLRQFSEECIRISPFLRNASPNYLSLIQLLETVERSSSLGQMSLRIITEHLLSSGSFLPFHFLSHDLSEESCDTFVTRGLQGLLIDSSLEIPPPIADLEEAAKAAIASERSSEKKAFLLYIFLKTVSQRLFSEYKDSPLCIEFFASMHPTLKELVSESPASESLRLPASGSGADDESFLEAVPELASIPLTAWGSCANNKSSLEGMKQLLLKGKDYGKKLGPFGQKYLILKALELCTPDNPHALGTLHALLPHIDPTSDFFKEVYLDALSRFPTSLIIGLYGTHPISDGLVDQFTSHTFADLLRLDEGEIPDGIRAQAIEAQDKIRCAEDPKRRQFLLHSFILHSLSFLEGKKEDRFESAFLKTFLPFGQKRFVSFEDFTLFETLERAFVFKTDLPTIYKGLNLKRTIGTDVEWFPIPNKIFELRIEELTDDSPLKVLSAKTRELGLPIRPLSIFRIHKLLSEVAVRSPLETEERIIVLFAHHSQVSLSEEEKALTLKIIRDEFASLPPERIDRIKHCIWEQLGSPDTNGEDTAGRLLEENIFHPAVQSGMRLFQKLESKHAEALEISHPAQSAAAELRTLLVGGGFYFPFGYDKVTMHRYSFDAFSRLDQETKEDCKLRLWMELGCPDTGGTDITTPMFESGMISPPVIRALRRVLQQHRTYFTESQSTAEKIEALRSDTDQTNEFRFLQAMALRPDDSLPAERLKEVLRDLYGALDKRVQDRFGEKIYLLDGSRSTIPTFGEDTFLENPLADLVRLAATRIRGERTGL